MTIEFKINLDDGTNAISVDPRPLPNAPLQQQLGPHAHDATNLPPPGDPPGPGPKPGGGPGSGSGMVFVVGPIIICGSGSGQPGPGGDQPLQGPRPGKPPDQG